MQSYIFSVFININISDFFPRMIYCVIIVFCDHLKTNKYFLHGKNALTDKWLIFVSGVESENCNCIFKCIYVSFAKCF